MKMSTTKKLDIMLNAIGNVEPWEQMHRKKMKILNQNHYMQDQKYSGKCFIINKSNAKNIHLLYQERQKTQRQ